MIELGELMSQIYGVVFLNLECKTLELFLYIVTFHFISLLCLLLTEMPLPLPSSEALAPRRSKCPDLEGENRGESAVLDLNSFIDAVDTNKAFTLIES